ncbi:hypothetical protein FHR32_001270 [Streptosporangium album]|uniref:Uncharacterized protein n=1 Tax=Streptosporangium album TaxID=47479 RepID=A0A7W7RRP3_9ACTN|nr:hypothetical protein [Streptosporangium album]
MGLTHRPPRASERGARLGTHPWPGGVDTPIRETESDIV